MTLRFNNHWQSLVILLSVIGYFIQPILADGVGDGHGIIAEEAVPEGLGAPWPMKKPTPSTVQAAVSMNTTEYEVENGSPYPERLIGGDDAFPGAYPFMVITFKAGEQWCGGTLLDKQHILSSAHCFNGANPSDVVVHLGDFDTSTNDEVRHIERRVKEITLAPDYDARKLLGDISILTMDAPVQLTRAVQPVKLASVSQSYDGKVGLAIGWGCTKINEAPTSILRQVPLPIVSNARCQIPDSKICTYHIERSICQGDFGGPLMVYEGKWVQGGVASTFSHTLEGWLGPSTFTRITDYLPWIHQNLT